MVSHDFFTVTDCAQRIFILENGTLREMSGRAYRKSIYKKYFGSDIFEQERNRIDTERKVNRLILKNKFDEAGKCWVSRQKDRYPSPFKLGYRSFSYAVNQPTIPSSSQNAGESAPPIP